MDIKNTLTLSISFVLSSFYWNGANAQVYLEKYSSGHADISLRYKVGKFKIVIGPCFTAGREEEYIDLHVSTVKEVYSYEEVWVKHSAKPMNLVKGTIKVDTVKRTVVIDLYEESNGKTIPLVVNGKRKLIIEELKNYSGGEMFPDNCTFKN